MEEDQTIDKESPARHSPELEALAGGGNNDQGSGESESVSPSTLECENCSTNKGLYVRAVADYQNLQKEVSLQRSEWVRMSEAQILEEFLPVYSNFKKAFSVERVGKSDDGWAKGIEYIMKQFGDVLKAHGVEEIKTVGEVFDPRLHEAVGEEESDGKPGTIIREVDGGYQMKGKVLKTAKVVVAK